MPDETTASDVNLSVRGMKELARDVDVDRISDDACIRIAQQEERRIKEKIRLASVVASRAGRETVREKDLHVVENILETELPP